ncbi:NAD(P)-dependent oxidoreductase [Pseudomonas viciae]|nr:NAD(P)-dependent oxidoreductase [Pseudomonas viciae]UZE86873.1 hypothetical protein LOY66_01895 [Pseudomonas viciae]
MRKVLVTGDFDVGGHLFPDDVEVVHIRCPVDEQQIMDVLPYVHDYILGGPEYLSSHLMEVAVRLENVVVMGTSISSFVDMECATKKGIKLANTPSMNVQAVTEFTLAMITVSLAKVFESVENVKEGAGWIQTPRLSLSKLRVGFVGMGAIASEMAHQLHLRECTTMYYWSRSRRVGLETSLGLRYATLVEMVNTVDILCIHLKGCAETYNLIDEFILAGASTKLKILNMSNPKIICPAALKKYLQNNADAFCFIDGYYNEWVDNKGQHSDPYGLLSLPAKNLVVTSHLAGQEQEVVNSIFMQAKRTLELTIER